MSAEQFLNQQILELRDQRVALIGKLYVTIEQCDHITDERDATQVKLDVAVRALQDIQNEMALNYLEGDWQYQIVLTAKDALRKLAPPDGPTPDGKK